MHPPPFINMRVVVDDSDVIEVVTVVVGGSTRGVSVFGSLRGWFAYGGPDGWVVRDICVRAWVLGTGCGVVL